MQLHMPYQDKGLVGQTPLRWQDDMSGMLPEAVTAFLAYKETPQHLEVVRAYCEYYVLAPCWEVVIPPEALAQLEAIRASIKQADTRQALQTWLEQCLELGIDPL